MEREQVWGQKGQERIVSFKNVPSVFLDNSLGCLKGGRETWKPRWVMEPPQRVTQLEQPLDSKSLSLHTTVTRPWRGESDVYK